MKITLFDVHGDKVISFNMDGFNPTDHVGIAGPHHTEVELNIDVLKGIVNLLALNNSLNKEEK